MLSPKLLAALPVLLHGAALRAEPLKFFCEAPLDGEVDVDVSCRGGDFSFIDLELTPSSAGESGRP